MKRSVALPVVAMVLTTLFGSSPRPAAGQACKEEGPQVGRWKTWVLSSGSEIPVPAPPADDSAQTKAELAELRQFQALRGPATNKVIDFWSSVPATQRWTDVAISLIAQNGINSRRRNRIHAIVHTAMYDALVAAYHAKYTYNRKPPSVVANDLIPAATVSADPSYPSEHAAIAAAAAGTLTYLFPKEEKSLAAMAQEADVSRLLAGTNYRSDVDAGSALGKAVAEKAIARASTDGSDAKFTGTIPTGPGYWIGTDPLEPMAGTWKPWLMTSGSQFRPGPPLAFGSPEYKAQLAEVKRINASVTPTERAIATFWATMSGAIWHGVAYSLIARDGVSTPCAARIMALLTATQMDATVALSDAKYVYWTIRPWMVDPSIHAIIPDPNFPGYPSGGATEWTAASEVLAYFFPQDAGRLRYMAAEGVISRLYAGVHFRFDLESGQEIGRRLGQLAAQRDAMNGN
jgi:membrane-associated phospholipid phosphatase